jgi:hypothetical protein
MWSDSAVMKGGDASSDVAPAALALYLSFPPIFESMRDC